MRTNGLTRYREVTLVIPLPMYEEIVQLHNEFKSFYHRPKSESTIEFILSLLTTGLKAYKVGIREARKKDRLVLSPEELR